MASLTIADYHALDSLRRQHPAWRLLIADHAPLIISILHRHFIEPNTRAIARDELIAKAEDELFRLREQLGEDAFPRSAAQYLDEWAADEKGWLRKYYPSGSDNAHYDVTPATEKAIAWIVSLEDRHFVGTESRVRTVIELLRQLTQGTELDPNTRLEELEKRKAQIDAEILRVLEGELLLLDPTQVKERFLQMAEMARGILSDFRELDQNFRDLDRSVRERIATSAESRGVVLDAVFGDRDEIESSDQGKSFRAFWGFLMSPDRQEELSTLLQSVMTLDPVRSLSPDPRLARIHYDWLEAGEVAQRTVARLSQQLRKYLDDQAHLENRRITQLIFQIEQHALAIRSQFPGGPSMAIDDTRPSFDLPFERPLFSMPPVTSLDSHPLEPGDENIPAGALFDQVYVDRRRLAQNVRHALQDQEQVSLTELVRAHPLEHGLAELVAYLSVASDDRFAVIDDTRTDQISWCDADGAVKQATLPCVIFLRPPLAI
jgi:hypothetical protein